MLTKENIFDICTLQTKATDMTYDEFVSWVKENCVWRAIEGAGLIDFDYESLQACISSDRLCGSFDCYDEEGCFMDNFVCDSIYFKRATA